VPGRETDPARLLDQVAHLTRCPQRRVVSQGQGSSLQTLLNAAQVVGRQPGLASSPRGALQTREALRLELLLPATHRLAMHPDAARHFRLAQSLGQEPCGAPSAALHSYKIPSDSSRISHGRESSTKNWCGHYILSFSISCQRGRPISTPMRNAGCAACEKSAWTRSLVLSERHLRYVLKEYVKYFMERRPHQGLEQQLPDRTEESPATGRIRCRQVLDGLINDYYREAA